MKFKRDNGFSLIEVLIALAILSMGLLAVARLQVAAIKSLSYSRHLSTATQLGQEQLEFLRTLPFIPNLPDQAPRDETLGEIRSYYNGSPASPFSGDNTENDGLPSGWHSHWNNPMNETGDRAGPGQTVYYIRWTIERGETSRPAGGYVFGVPGINQMEIHLQVIWWENNRLAPTDTSHAAISGWDNTYLRTHRAQIVDLRTIRLRDL